MPSDENRGLALLSLDGGSWENYGALTQIHVVEDILHKYEIDNNLEEGTVRISDIFDLIVGTGTGGLVGCMLGPLRMSTADANEAYLRIYASNFLSTNQPSERAEILEDALKRVLDSGTGDDANIGSTTTMSSVEKVSTTCKFAVTAMAAANLSKPVMLRGYPGRSSPIQCTLLEALLATLSDAQILPPVALGDKIIETFVATTIGRCNPTETLLEEIPAIFNGREISSIVNVGSGRPSPVSLSGQGNFANAVLDLAKSCHAVSQSMVSRFSGNPGLFIRLDVDGCHHSGGLTPGAVISHSRVYLLTEEIQMHLNALVHSLKCRPKRLKVNQVSRLQAGILEKIDSTLNSVTIAEEARILEKLNVSNDAPFTSSLPANFQRQSCTPGTRIAILHKLLEWANPVEPELKNCLFWLYGLAGTGKTTILRDICEKLQKLDLLASSYFCSIQLSSGDSRHLVPTIAKHLASRLDTFKTALVSQLKEDPNLFSAALARQFENLLCKPWRAVADAQGCSSAMVVVIDALDECDRGEEFLSLLLDSIDEGQIEGLRFIVTSRPVPRLLEKVRILRPESPQVSLHEVPKEEVNDDIKLYLEASLKLPPPRIKDLVARADGLFIYAATIVKYLSPSQPLTPIELEERLENALAHKPEGSSINPLYRQIVEVALSFDDEQVMRRRWMVLHAILCAGEPPSAKVVAGLLGIDSEVVTAVVESLYSVLFTVVVGGPIYIFHASFHDFIISCVRGEFRCHSPSIHFILAQACVTEMATSLRFNICGLESSFIADADLDPSLDARVVKHIGDLLAYASRNWWNHVKGCDEKSQSILLPRLEEVLQGKGIFWIEVMSLLDDIRGGKEILTELVYTSSIVQNAPGIASLARQAAKLVSLYDSVHMKITSHLYLSFLALAEETKEGIHWRDLFSPLPQVLSQQPIENRDCQLVVNVHPYVLSIAFSPDGMRWVAGSSGNIVLICDTKSGKTLLNLEGHTDKVLSVAFSPDNKSIVSGSEDKTVRIWDADSGKELQKLEGHTDYVCSVVYSPNGKNIISGSWDNTVRIWEAKSGKQLQNLKGHTSGVSSVAYSPHGKTIVSGSWDNTVRIWDAESHKQLQKLKGHTFGVRSVAFSPDGKHIAAATGPGTIHIFDSHSGRQLQKLKGSKSQVLSLGFSPDGKRLVSGSDDCTVRIWDAHSGKQVQYLEGHQRSVRSVAFSPDGKCIISGSTDSTVRIWDSDFGKHFQKQSRKLQGHRESVSCVFFSPDGSRIISLSNDRTVCTWDAQSGRRLQKFKSGTNVLLSGAISPDGKRIVSGSGNKTVRLWGAESSKELQKLDGHTSSVNSVAFSLDGKSLVSGSSDETVRIWDAESGKQLQKLERHTSSVNSVAFSPDGKRIASGSGDKTVRLWDAQSGKELQKLDGHTSSVNSVAFSPDGQSIVSGSSDRTVRIWDTESGEQLQKLERHAHNVTSVAFSPDRRSIVSGSWDNTVRLWDAESGQEIQKFDGHISSVSCVAFSPDGNRIVSGSKDNTVRIWDVQSSISIEKLDIQTDLIHSIIFSADVRRVKPVAHYSNPEFPM
ncbi:WD40-repeat-containing domain protein [Flagelloscypha sp. PMI_526]|nr:WD40-repeat-containing domain protein [Flagelloscypha sp. PMI_526]